MDRVGNAGLERLCTSQLRLWSAERNGPGSSRKAKSDLDRGLIIQTVKNAAWALQFSLVSGFLAQLLGLVVNLTLGLTFNGIWAIVIQLAGWCMLLSEGLFRGIDNPLMIHLKEERSVEGVRSRIPLLISIQGYVAVAITRGMVCLSPWFLDVWLGPRLPESVSESSEFMTDSRSVHLLIANARRAAVGRHFGAKHMHAIGEDPFRIGICPALCAFCLDWWRGSGADQLPPCHRW